jgi:hypothetical protein
MSYHQPDHEGGCRNRSIGRILADVWVKGRQSNRIDSVIKDFAEVDDVREGDQPQKSTKFRKDDLVDDVTTTYHQ